MASASKRQPPRRKSPAKMGGGDALRRAKALLEDMEGKARDLRAQITCMELDGFASDHPGVAGFSVSATWQADHEGEHRLMLWASLDFDHSADDSEANALYGIKEEIEAIFTPWGSQLLGRKFEAATASQEVGEFLMGTAAYARWASSR